MRGIEYKKKNIDDFTKTKEICMYHVASFFKFIKNLVIKKHKQVHNKTAFLYEKRWAQSTSLCSNSYHAGQCPCEGIIAKNVEAGFIYRNCKASKKQFLGPIKF